MEVLTLDSWLLTEPNFNNPAVFVPAFKNTIQPGHFVKVIVDGNELIGRIIATSVGIGEVNNSTHLPICEQRQVRALNAMTLVNWFSPRPSLVFAPSIAEPTSTVL